MDRFRIITKMGPKVWKCNDFARRNGGVVTVKCVDEYELSILEKVADFENQFITLYYSFSHLNSTYAVMEYVDSDLIDYLEENDLSEGDGRAIFVGILCAVIDLLKITGYYHGDLKPENVVIDEFKNVKLIDFGVMVKRGKKIDGGTVEYYPPEKKEGPIEPFVVWTLGLILFRLLTGRDLPYDDEEKTVVIASKVKAAIPTAKPGADLLLQCLHEDYRKRPSLKQLKKHKWITGTESGGWNLCCTTKKE